MFRSKYAAAAGAVVLAGGVTAALLTATSAFASAGGNPQPTPTYTTKPPVVCPPGTVLVGDRCEPVRVNPLQQQEFDIQDANPLPNGWVLGTGPISIVGGLDKQVPGNDRVDILESANGVDGVRINHEPLGGDVVIDQRTCSVLIAQFDQPWSIHQGFGRFRGAIGNGLYDLTGLWSFPTRYNRCTLPRGLTAQQALDNFNGLGGVTLPDPLAVSVDVQAVGRAAVVRTVPNPCPTPTRSVFSPTNGSDHNKGGDCPVPTPTRSVFAPVG